MGPPLGRARADQRLRRLRCAGRHATVLSNCRPAPILTRRVSSPACIAGNHGPYVRHAAVIAAPAARPPRPAAARPAHLGHGPLQLPLPVLHAARALPRALRLPEDRRAAVLRGNPAPGAPVRAHGRAQAAHHRRRAAAAREPARPDRRPQCHPRRRGHRPDHQRRAARQACLRAARPRACRA